MPPGIKAEPAPPAKEDVRVPFEDLFSPVRSIAIQGREDAPVFSVTHLAASDSMLVVLDQQSATLTAFTRDGTFLYQTGRPGKGPGEFTNPAWVGFDARNRLVVLEGMSNYRIQLLSAEDGRSLDVLTEDITVAPYSNAFLEGTPGDQRIIFHTIASCPGDKQARCLVQEHSLTDRTMLHRFGSAEEVNPDAKSIPWIMGRGSDDRTYVAHVWGPDVVVYGPDGAYLDRFSISQISTFRPLDQEALPESRQEVFDALQDEEYSTVSAVTAVGDDVIVSHQYEKRYLSVFSQDGTHRATTTTDHVLGAIQGDRFFFVEADKEAEVGSYMIYEYRYTGPGR
jgi:hypothetical protein